MEAINKGWSKNMLWWLWFKKNAFFVWGAGWGFWRGWDDPTIWKRCMDHHIKRKIVQTLPKDFMKQNFLVCRCDFDSQQCFIHNKCHKCKSLPAVNQKSSVQKSIHAVIRIFYCFWRAWHVGQTNWDFMCQCRIWMTFYLCTPDIRSDVCMATLSRLHLSVCITIL